jgi:signal transduction histidine kinase
MGIKMSKEIQVLFIDDEESIIDGVQRLFKREAYGIFATTSPDKAREVLAKEKIKVVVCDHRMPGITGVEFLKEVKEKYPDVVKVLFTGYADFSAAQEAINVGEIYRYISKPWKTSELLSIIRQCIEHYDLIVSGNVHKEELEIANKRLRAMCEIQKEFTSTVSHELRTPLASIKTAIDLVLKKMVGEINEEQKEVLGRAKSNVDRLKRLIDDILDVTKMESGKLQMNFKINDIHRVIQETAEAQKEVAEGRGLYIKTELDVQVPKILFDRDRIIQVLNNLLNNAVKFTKHGGITIKTQKNSQENHIVVSIKDTGKGIAEADISKLFQRFHQIDSTEINEESGTGLGLAICNEIISQHGGKIWVESKLGEGTTFNFILPIQERSMPS